LTGSSFNFAVHVFSDLIATLDIDAEGRLVIASDEQGDHFVDAVENNDDYEDVFVDASGNHSLESRYKFIGIQAKEVNLNFLKL
jgi:hypothetical protein